MGQQIEPLAEFVAQTQWEDVPTAVQRHTKLVLLDTLGVILAGGERPEVRQLRDRRWDQTELLVIYVDGQRFGAHHVISAVGIDREGAKHVLGMELGATELYFALTSTSICRKKSANTW